jgi:hypothetical protein
MERIDPSVKKVLGIVEMFFKGLGSDEFTEFIKDTFKEDTEKDLKKIRLEKEYVLPFLDAIKGFVPDANVVVISDSYFIYDKTPKKGFTEITYSPEKNKVYFYVIHKDGRKKVFAKKFGDEIKSKEILKFVREMIDTIKTEMHHRNLELSKNSKKFDLKLFKKNIEKDLGIKIIHFKIHTDKPSYILKYNSDEVSLKEIADYLDEYFAELKQMKIKIPRVIEIKE